MGGDDLLVVEAYDSDVLGDAEAAFLEGAVVAMLTLLQIANQYLTLLPMRLLGIAWASMMGVQTFTFGWIFENVLRGDGTNAIIFSGVLFAIGVVAMLFVSPPKETEKSEIMPLGAPRRIDNVYNRVVVGSRGCGGFVRLLLGSVSQNVAAHAKCKVVVAR